MYLRKIKMAGRTNMFLVGKRNARVNTYVSNLDVCATKSSFHDYLIQYIIRKQDIKCKIKLDKTNGVFFNRKFLKQSSV